MASNISQPGIDSQTVVQTGIGRSAPLRVLAPSSGTYGGIAVSQQPAIIAVVAGTVTFNIDVTGDFTTAAGYSEATGNWASMQASLNITTLLTLGAVVTAISVNITAGTGSVTLQFVQYSGRQP